MAVDRSRLAAALAYRQAEEERRRRMMESVPIPGAELPAPAPSQNLRRDLENLSIGIGEGLTSQLEGVKGIVTDPIGAARGAYEGVKAVVRDPSIIADALRYTAQKVGSGPLGAGEVIGEMIGPRKTGPTIAELDVYHGTPHRFPATEANPLGEFDASKIGTGEGAQAYGHGIYYAESPDVAENYRVGTTFAQKADRDIAEMLYSQKSGDADAAIASLKSEIKQLEKQGMPEGYKEQYDFALQKLQKFKKNPPKGGSLYKADLPDEMIDRMLDWDKPFLDQSQEIKDFAKTMLPPRVYDRVLMERTGDFLEALGVYKGGKAKAAELLRQAGIPGIKYLDAGSRGQGGSGTRNFVVFPGEEKKVRILERDGQKAPPQKIAQALEAAPSKAAKAEPQPFGVQGYLNDDLRRVKQNFFSQYGVEENKQFSKDYEVVELAKLKPSENINESKIQSLMKTMREEGNARDNPIPPIIVDSEGNILDGHHRYEAAKRLGAKYVPIVELFDKRKGPVFSE